MPFKGNHGLNPFNDLVQFIKPIFSQRNLIWTMAKRDVSSRYAGSLLGFLWTFIQPVMMILVLWAIFGLGFRVRPGNDTPFIVWLTAGMAAWFCFAEIVNQSTGVIVAHSHMVKKVFFHSHILPLVRTLAGLVTHAVYIGTLLVLIGLMRLPFNIYWLQFFYYLFCMLVLALGISWGVSALNVFIRDVEQVVRVVLRIGFWFTPVFWNIQMMPEHIRIIFQLNPMFYIIQGYRDSFIYGVPFWHHPLQTIYFWTVTGFLVVIGALIFKLLKPQFADVL